MQLRNSSPQHKAIAGINGIAAGGNALLTLDPGFRYHRLDFSTECTYYTGTVPVSPSIIKSANGIVGTGTIKPTIINYVVNAIVGTAGNSSGFQVGDTITFPDPTGVGCVLTCNNAAGTLATANWTVSIGGTASPCPPSVFIPGQILLQANGTTMQDISCPDILGIRSTRGYPCQFGQLAIDFTDPRYALLPHAEYSSWDLCDPDGTEPAGMVIPRNFTVQFQVNSLISNPSIVGSQEYDLRKNMRYSRSQGKGVRFQNPVVRHTYSKTLVSGNNPFTDIPHKSPIRSIYVIGSVPGNIYQLYVYPDGAKTSEATTVSIASRLADYGFTFNQLVNSGLAAPTNLTPNGPVASNYFDAAWVADYRGGDPGAAVNVAGGLEIDVWSSIGQTCRIIIESLPGGFTG